MKQKQREAVLPAAILWPQVGRTLSGGDGVRRVALPFRNNTKKVVRFHEVGLQRRGSPRSGFRRRQLLALQEGAGQLQLSQRVLRFELSGLLRKRDRLVNATPTQQDLRQQVVEYADPGTIPDRRAGRVLRRRAAASASANRSVCSRDSARR